MIRNARNLLGVMLLAMLAGTMLKAQSVHGQSAGPPGAENGVPQLNHQTYEQWLRYILPDEDANAWRKISWRTTLWEALQEARKTQRPILLWTMNGHPCGSV